MSTFTSAPSRRRLLASLVAGFTAVAAFNATSCAAPRWPVAGYPLRSHVGGYELQVLVDGVPARSFDYGGETHVLGALGARYTLRVVNRTGRRVEAVVSVDGRDAIDGKGADARTKRGYLIPAWGAVDIDGWRLSRAEVAAFRFSSVADSYAARTGGGRDVGVIGVAVFPERHVPPPRVYAPPVVPYQPLPYAEPYDSYPRGGLGAAPRSSAADERARTAEAKKSAGAPSARQESAPAPAPPSAGRAADSLAEADAYARSAPVPTRRPGLGTEFGEAVSSPVREVTFVRANASTPAVVLGARYNDRDGLLALGIDVDGIDGRDDDLAWRQTATPFPAGGDRRYAAPPRGWQSGCCVR